MCVSCLYPYLAPYQIHLNSAYNPSRLRIRTGRKASKEARGSIYRYSRQVGDSANVGPVPGAATNWEPCIQTVRSVYGFSEGRSSLCTYELCRTAPLFTTSNNSRNQRGRSPAPIRQGEPHLRPHPYYQAPKLSRAERIRRKKRARISDTGRSNRWHLFHSVDQFQYSTGNDPATDHTYNKIVLALRYG